MAETRSETVGAYEAKTHLPRLLRLVEEGETVIITKHGHPIAQIVPYSEGHTSFSPGGPAAHRAEEQLRELRAMMRSRPDFEPITQEEWRAWSRDGLE